MGDRCVRRRSERLLHKRHEEVAAEEVVSASHKTSQSVSKRVSKRTPNKRQFVCEKCLTAEEFSQHFRRQSKPKQCFDSVLQKSITVCRHCAKRMTTSTPTTAAAADNSSKMAAIEDNKKKYLSSCHSFGHSLAQLLNDSSAERLYCPNVKTSGNACACLQRYVIGMDDNMSDKKERARHLLELLTRGRRLSEQKSYSVVNVSKTGQKIGLGNGHKKSKEFETFVSESRRYLRNELQFCEKAAQRVLFYSNNFLHKRLKTEPNGGRRVSRVRGKAATGRLLAIDAIAQEVCCGNGCVRLSQTHPQLLDTWRQRATGGQQEARRVLAEMLTPTQAVRTNCFKFIQLVTGCSHRTVAKVDQYMRSNGGLQEPGEHGLKKFWFAVNDKKQTNGQTNELTANEAMDARDEEVADNSATDELSVTLADIPQEISFETNDGNDNQTIHLLVDKSNAEISVINGGRHETMIAILSPQMDFFANEHTIQIPVSIGSLQFMSN